MSEPLAIHGGTPVRSAVLPYGRQTVEDDDVAAVTAVLRSDWLTTGPMVTRFENAFAAHAGTACAVAVNSGTAALHATMFALRIGPGDDVILPPLTFAATATAVVLQGARPVFADVDADTLLLDPRAVENKFSERTRAIIGVDFGGQPCDYEALGAIAKRHGVALVADACHAVGATMHGRPAGSLADLTAFSFHPVKNMTTGEGGMITTNDKELAQRMRLFRNHCISTDHHERSRRQSWEYTISEVGYNYRLTDLQSALGLCQLEKLPRLLDRRRAIATRYAAALAEVPGIHPLRVRDGVEHAYHLYVVRIDGERLGVDRANVFAAMRAEGIGVNVHYIPIHLQPLYRERFGTRLGDCPVAEEAYTQILSLPIFATMSDSDADDVTAALTKITKHYSGMPT